MNMTVSPEEFAELQKRAGVPADQTHGTIQKDIPTLGRVTAGWSYADNVLIVTILKKPWMLSEDYITKRFCQWAGLPVPPAAGFARML